MGKSSSKELRIHDSSASYLNADEEVIEEVPTLHAGPIHSLCVVDEDHFASGGVDKDVTLYCWTSHINKARFRGPTKDVTKVRYNSISSMLYAASRDRVVYAWRWPNESPNSLHNSFSAEVLQETTKRLERHTLGVTALACSETHPHLLCSGSRDNSICLWDVDNGTSISSMHIPRNLVTGLEWVEPEMAVLQSSEDKTLRLWDLRSCSVVQHFRARQYVQLCCAVSVDGNYFLGGSSGSGSIGSELSLWDRRVEKKPLRVYRGHTEGVQDCLFFSHTKDCNLLASGGSDSTVRLWDRDNGNELHMEYVPGAGPITSVVSPSQGLVACSSFKAGVVVWTVLSLERDMYRLTLRAKY